MMINQPKQVRFARTLRLFIVFFALLVIVPMFATSSGRMEFDVVKLGFRHGKVDKHARIGYTSSADEWTALRTDASLPKVKKTPLERVLASTTDQSSSYFDLFKAGYICGYFGSDILLGFALLVIAGLYLKQRSMRRLLNERNIR